MKIVNCQTHGQVSQDSCSWTKATWRVHVVGRRLTRKQTTSRPDNVRPDMSDAAKSKAKQKWAIEKPKLDNARQLRGIFFIEPEDEEFKHTMKNVCRKLEIPMSAAMPWKTPRNCRGETCRSIGKHKAKHACSVDADESMRIRLEGVPQRYHEDHIAAKGMNSLSHVNLVHKFIPMPQALKIPDAKAAVATRKTEQLYKVSTLCLDDHQFIGELSKVCSQIVLKWLYFARIGRPDIPWSVN